MLKIKDFLAFKLSDVFIMLINVKMLTIVGGLTFMNMTNSMLIWVEHENYFINLSQHTYYELSGIERNRIFNNISKSFWVSRKIGIFSKTWPRGYKTFSMLNSAEPEIYSAHKC